MYLFLMVLLGAIVLGWVALAFAGASGILQMRHISALEPLPDSDCPPVTILYAARDEERELPRAIASLLALDYPNLEIVAVDDRSTDGTADILDEAAGSDPRLKVLHLDRLPPGWLGKPHALTRGFELSTGEWILLTDADVRMAPSTLRRTLRLALENRLDHLTATARIDMEGFWEKTIVSYFGLGFALGQRPWENRRADSKRYVGVGAFQLVRRSAYEAVGTHRRLAMEVVEDMKVAKLIKEGGYRSETFITEDFVRVRWQHGFRNTIRGLTKNTFAAMNFSVAFTLGLLTQMLISGFLPFLLLPFLSGWPLALALSACALAVASHGATSHTMGISPFYGLTHPLGTVLFGYVMVRSMVVTLARRGIIWRDTFHSLEELRKGRV